MIIVIMGASGSGKSTLMGECVEQGCPRIRTNTTRKRRVGESEDAYNFLTREQFIELIDTGMLVEHAMYGGEYYGVGCVDAERGGVVVVEPEGFYNLRRLYGDDVYSILMRVSDDERVSRVKLRGDDINSLQSRLQDDHKLFTDALAKDVDVVLNNPRNEDYSHIASMCRALYLQRQEGGGR